MDKEWDICPITWHQCWRYGWHGMVTEPTGVTSLDSYQDVQICAWCFPRCGKASSTVKGSHGICQRHLAEAIAEVARG